MSSWQRDELEGFEFSTLELPREDDGALCATLVRRRREPAHDARPTVLYLHGYVDYFFHVHLADAYEKAGFDLVALDLRRSGRSLRPGNVPHQFAQVDEYFREIDWAIETSTAEGQPISAIVAHSTGGLIACHYAARGRHREELRALVLNSPFFDFRANAVERAALGVMTKLGRSQPRFPAPVKLSPIYVQSLHRNYSGSWAFDLAKKPLSGFGVTAGWLSAVAAAHALLQAGLELRCAVLIQHSARSRRSGRSLVEADLAADLVLDVEHMKRFAGAVGPRVELQEIEGGLHDLTLSREPARTEAIQGQLDFLTRNLG